MHRTKGPYFVDGTGYAGQGNDSDIINSNNSDPTQPGLWCQWIPNDEGNAIEWNGVEKFYDSAEWMTYLINHFLGSNPIVKQLHPECFSFLQGHMLNGQIEAQGEETSDHWYLKVNNNKVSILDSQPSDMDSEETFSTKTEALKYITKTLVVQLPINIKYMDNQVIISYNSEQNDELSVF
jgi:hypothetical protein